MRAAFHALCDMLWCTALPLYHITYLHVQTNSQSVNCYANICRNEQQHVVKVCDVC